MVVPLVPASKSLQISSLDYRQAHDQVYAPNKYSVCAPPAASNQTQCWLLLSKPVDCDALFTDYIEVLQKHKPVYPPPKQLDPAQKDEFLLQGFTQLSEYYMPQKDYAPDAEVPVWTESTISELVQKAKARQQVGHYGNDCHGIYQALDCHPVLGTTGAVFGTEAPWLEAILFAFGTKHIFTVEFRTTVSKIPNHTMLKPLDWAQGWKSGKVAEVDYAFSFSSWEHDGLARYGDPLDPWGDIKAVQRTACYVKPGGLLYVGGPMSTIDQIQYNAHRIYGFVRLPLLTADWEVLGVYETNYSVGVCGQQTCDGLYSHWQEAAPLGNYGFQPVLVLRNLRTTPCTRSV